MFLRFLAFPKPKIIKLHFPDEVDNRNCFPLRKHVDYTNAGYAAGLGVDPPVNANPWRSPETARSTCVVERTAWLLHMSEGSRNCDSEMTVNILIRRDR